MIVEQIYIGGQPQMVVGGLHIDWGNALIGGVVSQVISASPVILIAFDDACSLSNVPAFAEVDFVLRNEQSSPAVRFSAELITRKLGLSSFLLPQVVKGMYLLPDDSNRVRFVLDVEAKVNGLRLEMI